LAFRHVRQGIAHPMHATALPAGAKHAGDRQAQSLMSIRDHQLDALQATLDQPLQEGRPERLGFGRANPEPDDLAPAVGADRDSDYRGDRDYATAVANLQVGGVEPQIRPFALDWSVEEGAHPLIDVFAQLGDLALRDAG